MRIISEFIKELNALKKHSKKVILPILLKIRIAQEPYAEHITITFFLIQIFFNTAINLSVILNNFLISKALLYFYKSSSLKIISI